MAAPLEGACILLFCKAFFHFLLQDDVQHCLDFFKMFLKKKVVSVILLKQLDVTFFTSLCKKQS